PLSLGLFSPKVENVFAYKLPVQLVLVAYVVMHIQAVKILAEFAHRPPKQTPTRLSCRWLRHLLDRRPEPERRAGFFDGEVFLGPADVVNVRKTFVALQVGRKPLPLILPVVPRRGDRQLAKLFFNGSEQATCVLREIIERGLPL